MKNDTTVHVTARLQARPETQEALRHAARALSGPTRTETGCLRYDLYEHTNAPGCFLFIEQWQTADDLARHLQQPHIQAFIQTSADLLAEPLQIAQWQALD